MQKYGWQVQSVISSETAATAAAAMAWGAAVTNDMTVSASASSLIFFT